MSKPLLSPRVAVALAMFLLSFGLVLFELALTRIFAVVMFASFAHMALALALLGISLGATLQHMWPQLLPDKGLEGRLAWLSLAQAVTTAAAAWCAVNFPLTKQFAEAPEHFGERSSIAWNLIDPLWSTALLPVLAIPFTVVGLAFAGTFQRRKEDIGLIYGADLIGGAFGALMFIPLLSVLPAPDVVWIVVLSGGLSAAALWASTTNPSLALAGLILATAGVVPTFLAGAGSEVLQIRYAAGYAEQNIGFTTWTPLTRIAIHTDEKRGPYMVLDNTSASRVITTPEARQDMAREAGRGLVYRLHQPPARIAILAASAGPEVASAQHYGHSNIDAIDIAAEIGEVVATHWPDSPVNPYLQPDTRRVWSDGRAAILHAKEPYDIIQMVHANLHSSAGLLATAWSPNLLETVEAFHTYFDRLTDDGTLCFAASGLTRTYARSAAQALRERGVEKPGDHFVFIGGNQTFMLIKKRPWTPEETVRVRQLVGQTKYWGNQHVESDPLDRDMGIRRKLFRNDSVMTDNRPYIESPAEWVDSMVRVFERMMGDGSIKARPIDVVYNTLVLQTLFVLVAGSLLVLGPLLRRGPTGLLDVRGVGWGLLYVCGLGYGYLAVETVLIHELVLFVGHPTYAITVVIFSMLLFSGLGSIWVGRMEGDREVLTRRLQLVLGGVLVLGLVQAFVIPWLLWQFALGLPMALRIFMTGAALAPLGYLMGMPFPLALRILRPEAAGLVPWAWAFNGWTSVLASLGTVFFSRLLGYHQAFGVALLAYVLALVLAGKLGGIGRRAAG